jgi:hypothetical protein
MAAMKTVNFDIKLTKGQREAYDLIHRKDIQYVVLRWSRQCGKSVLAEVLLMEYLFKKGTYNAYISPSFNLGRKVFSEITKMLEDSGVVKKANATTLTIETIFDSTLQFLSMEAYTSIRGLTISGILVLDECSYYPDILPNGEEPWGNVIMPICKARKPKVVFISTPRGKRGMFYNMYLKAKEGVKGYAELSRTIYDDELVTKEEIEEIKKSVSELAFRQEFLIEFLDSSLTFFQGFEEVFSDYVFNDREKVWVGVDLSSTGEDNTVVTLINASMQVKQYVVSGNLDMKYSRIAHIIDSIPNLVSCYLENNGVGAPMIAQIKKQVRHRSKIYEWSTTNSSKEEIISALAVKIANKEIGFSNDDKGLFAELGRFVVKYSKTGKMQFEGASGSHDDRVMSLAIALRAREDFKSVGMNNNRFVRSNIKFFV